jgi:hypothetical protein
VAESTWLRTSTANYGKTMGKMGKNHGESRGKNYGKIKKT